MKPLSASQIELFRRCNRRWFFRYCTNLPKPAFNAATSLGTRVHRIAEVYQQTGTVLADDTDALAIFMPMMPHMPHPKTGKAEHRFDFDYEGVAYMGYMDWRGPGAVYDYKTSSDPAKYGLQGETCFLTHVQPLIYAQSALLEEKAEAVYLRWIYGKTKGKPKAHKVEATLSSKAVVPQFHTVVQAPAKEIVRLRVLSDLNQSQLVPNRSACYDFGTACEYMAHCQPDAIISTGEDDMDDGKLLLALQDLCGDDTPTGQTPAPSPSVDTINRPRRVSSRPPQTDKGVFLVAMDPAEVKKVISVAPKAEVAQPAQQPAPKQPASKPPVGMRSPTAIILEELSTALARAAERIG
jgi:hypothetical protein